MKNENAQKSLFGRMADTAARLDKTGSLYDAYFPELGEVL